MVDNYFGKMSLMQFYRKSVLNHKHFTEIYRNLSKTKVEKLIFSPIICFRKPFDGSQFRIESTGTFALSEKYIKSVGHPYRKLMKSEDCISFYSGLYHFCRLWNVLGVNSGLKLTINPIVRRVCECVMFFDLIFLSTNATYRLIFLLF